MEGGRLAQQALDEDDRPVGAGGLRVQDQDSSTRSYDPGNLARSRVLVAEVVKGVTTQRAVEVSVWKGKGVDRGQSNGDQGIGVHSSQHLRHGIDDDDPGVQGAGQPGPDVTGAAAQVGQYAAWTYEGT